MNIDSDRKDGSKKFVFLISLVVGVMIVAYICVFYDVSSADSKSSDDKAVQSVNSLAFDLYGKLKAGNNNLCFSPYSISSAFAMLYAGASGDTAVEMEKVFKYDEGIHESNAALAERLNNTSASAGELRIANSIWPMRGYSFLKSYTDLLRRDYMTEITPLNYKSSPGHSLRRINKWVEDKTDNRIVDILADGSIVTDTRMVLVNAIYFKSKWMHTFHEDMTTDADFYLSKGKTTKVKMMNRRAVYEYANMVGYQALKLPYIGGLYSMLVLLPRDKGGLPLLESMISEKLLEDINSSLSECLVEVFLPRFKAESDIDIKNTLEGLGVEKAFSSEADFSKMSDKTALCVSYAVHKAFVEMDEKGAEAAATSASAVVKGLTAMPAKSYEIITFLADHPFIFLIQENTSGAILFIGRVTKP